jgi:hypothetical protein
VFLLIMTIQVFDGLESEKQHNVLLGELRGGKGMTQKSSRCARLSEDLICLHNRFICSLDSTNRHRNPFHPRP